MKGMPMNLRIDDTISGFIQYIRTGTRRGARNPKWLLMFIISRFEIFRMMMISFRQNAYNYDLEKSLFKKLDASKVVETLKEDGCCLGINLPSESLNELLSYVEAADCYGDGDCQLGFPYNQKEEAKRKSGRRFVRADYFNATLDCPAIEKLACDPKILEIASQYLGGEPLFTGSRLWWLFKKELEDKALLLRNMTFLSLRKSAREGSYFFHYDLDDYRCLKFFFYLTEVDEQDGHVCIRGSHKKKKFSHLLSLSRRRPDADVRSFYHDESIVNIYGKPGSGFAEDTFCFHKATVPTNRDRLVLLLQFTLNDYRNKTDTVEPILLRRCV
jgi:hypothetical protein